MASYYHRRNLQDDRVTLLLNDKKKGVNSFSMIAPVQRINGHLETRLCFRTFDWLMSDRILSYEVDVENLS